MSWEASGLGLFIVTAVIEIGFWSSMEESVRRDNAELEENC